MKQCPACGVLLKDEAMRCFMCNKVLEVNMPKEELEALIEKEQRDPLEDEFEAFFKDQQGDCPSPFAPKKD